MSTDSSSNKDIQNKSINNNTLKSFLLIFGTIGLFFVGQIIGLYIAVAIMAMFGYSTTQIEDLLTNEPVYQFLTILLIEFITIGFLWWLHKHRKLSFINSVGLGSKPPIKSVVFAAITYVVYFVTLIISVAVLTFVIPSLDANQMQQIGFDNAAGQQLIFVFLTLVVMPPIAEEIIFRGFLYQRLKNLISIYPAAIITSIIFALAHTEFLGDNPLNWIAAIDTFILSFFLIFLLEKTKSLWASIFLHAIKNLIAFVLLFLL
jgi:membrane protease YdiL (CAAX protease family)